MAIVYKPFIATRTVFYTLFACFLLWGFPALAAEDLYTVEGVKVDVTAENALAARDQAFIKAQEEAFKTLASRMLSETGAESVAVPESATISTMIQDYEITEEKLSAVRYIGTYTFRFRDSAVKQYFVGSNVQYTDVSSRPVLILPFYQPEARALLWSPYNPWIQAWNRADSLGGLVPIIVPLGDLQDVKDIGEDEALTYDDRGLANILGRYDAGEAVVAIAIPDANLALVSGDQEPATGSLAVHIYRTDQGSPEKVQEIIMTASSQNRAQMLDDAVKKVHAALQKDWKQKTMVQPATQKNMMQVRVPFANLDEWSQIQRTLERVHGISQITLRSLSPKFARVDLIYQGDEARLRLALQQANVTLSAPAYTQAGYSATSSAQPPVYDLYVNRNRITEGAPAAVQGQPPTRTPGYIPGRAPSGVKPAPQPYSGRF